MEFDLPDDGSKRTCEVTLWLEEGWLARVSYENGPLSISGDKLLAKYYPKLWEPRPKKGNSDNKSKNLHLREMNRRLYPRFKGPSVRVYSYEIEGPLYDQWPPKSHTALYGDGDLDVESLLTRFARRAFRRPLEKGEIDPIIGLVQKRTARGTALREAIQIGLRAILVSPAFLYIQESDGPLGDHALASRLSYFLWSSMPDEELLALAGRGSLDDADVLRRQVERMLKDPKARTFVEHFTERWLRLDLVGSMPPDPKAFALYYEANLEDDIKTETHRFFQHLLSGNRPILDFLDSDYTFLNQSMARLYGIKGIEGRDFRRVTLKDDRRGGLLGQASILTATANGIDTNPIIRGVWVMENILGKVPPKPPPNIEPLPPDVRGARTVRELLAKHRNSPACNECHRKIDPLGFALENFDPIGAWRKGYGKTPVDASGRMTDGTSFSDIRGFKKILLEGKETFSRCLAEKMLTYAIGRSLDIGDRPHIDEIVEKLRARGYGLRDLVHLVVESRPFLNR